MMTTTHDQARCFQPASASPSLVQPGTRSQMAKIRQILGPEVPPKLVLTSSGPQKGLGMSSFALDQHEFTPKQQISDFSRARAAPSKGDLCREGLDWKGEWTGDVENMEDVLRGLRSLK
jgi:hypothetical protein